MKTRLDIKEAAEYLGKDPQWIRKLIRDHKIKSMMTRVPGTKIMKHEIEVAELDRYKTATTVHTTRSDGRNKFTIYLTQAELQKINEFCVENNLPEPVKTNAGEYERRKAKKLAEEAE